MTDALLIREYRESDRSDLERLAAQTVEDGTVFPFEDVAGVLDYWLTPRGRVWVACRAERVVGSYVLKPNHPDRCAHVANAGYMVDEASRGAGIGEALGRHSLEVARKQGYRSMQFNLVVSTNRAAVRLWQRLGFRIVGEVPAAFRHPAEGLVSVYVMVLEL